MTELRHLLGAYFHQDWTYEYDGSWEAAIDDFVRRAEGQAPLAAQQIDEVLAEDLDNDSLGHRLYQLGNYRHAGDEPDAYARWLRAVADRLRASGA